MRLKVMLVDDELPILQNLRMVLPWDEMRLDIVATARNGAEALEALKTHRPDIALCDIRMPVLDGMAFLAEARALPEGAACDVLMLTGYQEFEYARAALKHGVKDYILKPIDYELLERTVRNVANGIRAERAEHSKREKQWDRVAQLAYEKVLYDVLMGFPPEGALRVLADEDGWAEHTAYVVMLVDVDHYSRLSVQWDEKERKLWNFAVGNVLQEALQPFAIKYVSLHAREGEWCVLVERGPDAYDAAEAIRWMEAAQSAVMANVKLSVSVGVFPRPVEVAEVAETYKQLQRSFLQHAGTSRLLAVSETLAERPETEGAWWTMLDCLVSGVRQQDRARIDQALGRLQRAALPESVLHYVVIHLLREMREMDVMSQTEEEAVWKKLQHTVSLKDVMESIVQLVDHAMERALNKKSSELLMMSAKDYIDRRLASDLGVEEVADHLGISCSYFSLLFKNHFGETFVEYVTKQRMELAKSLLLMTDKSVAKIGALSGYAERRYFTKVFQRHTGMTPSEFRESKSGHGWRNNLF
ncbi:response regulator [Paenibacillus sp.]|uniref:response regulator transcription factor n=1 Tax=Paenibacillus sp. TaxID=58172 RepID=UPI002810EC7F|nr:response regulator [Paenibacillus sp.]